MLLRQLEVVYDMKYNPFEFDQFTNGPAGQLRKIVRAYRGVVHAP